MIIDSHTHLGRNHIISATVTELLRSMDDAQIDMSMVLAGRMNDADNEWLFEQIAPYRNRLLAVAAAHPLSSGHDAHKEMRDIVKWYKEGTIVGCKFYVGYDHYFPFDQRPREYLKELNEIGCPVIFHSGDCINTHSHAKLKYAHPIHIDEVAVDYPNINFVIAHMGFPWIRDAAEICYKNKNVYADISGFVYGEFTSRDCDKFKKVVTDFNDIVDSKKLLFGTDWPISNQKSYIIENKNLFDAQYLTRNTIEAFKLADYLNK